MRQLILRNGQSPGDIVMLTAAVRDLKRALGAALAVDVRTPCPALWENSPHLTPLADGDAGAEGIECGYPLIHRANNGAVAFHPRVHAVSRGDAGGGGAADGVQGGHPPFPGGKGLDVAGAGEHGPAGAPLARGRGREV